MGKIKGIKGNKPKNYTESDKKEVPYLIFENDKLVILLNKIYTCTKFNSNISYRICRLLDKMKEGNAQLISENKKLIEEYAEKNEDGTIKKNEKNEPIIPKDKEEELNKKYGEIINKTFSLPLVKIKVDSDLPDKTFSPGDFATLEIIFDLR